MSIRMHIFSFETGVNSWIWIWWIRPVEYHIKTTKHYIYNSYNKKSNLYPHPLWKAAESKKRKPHRENIRSKIPTFLNQCKLAILIQNRVHVYQFYHRMHFCFLQSVLAAHHLCTCLGNFAFLQFHWHSWLPSFGKVSLVFDEIRKRLRMKMRNFESDKADKWVCYPTFNELMCSISDTSKRSEYVDLYRKRFEKSKLIH